MSTPRLSVDQVEGLRLLMHAYTRSELVGATEIGRTTCSSLIRKGLAKVVYEMPRRVKITANGIAKFTNAAKSSEDISIAAAATAKLAHVGDGS